MSACAHARTISHIFGQLPGQHSDDRPASSEEKDS
jgi:xanthosine utilization system XapX-like protein